MLAYHVTESTNLPSILADGIQPRIGERSREFGEKDPAVYAFPTLDDCNAALAQWLGDWYTEKEEESGRKTHLAVVEFDASNLKQRPFEVEFEISFSDAVSPRLLRRVISEKDIHHLLSH